MKIGEAIQKCYENPGKIFESLKYLMMYDLDRELLVSALKNNNPNWFISRPIEVESFESDWQPVLQEVTWQEALETWLFKDKKVKCVHFADNDRVYDAYAKDISIDHIMNGKWYILED